MRAVGCSVTTGSWRGGGPVTAFGGCPITGVTGGAVRWVSHNCNCVRPITASRSWLSHISLPVPMIDDGCPVSRLPVSRLPVSRLVSHGCPVPFPMGVPYPMGFPYPVRVPMGVPYPVSRIPYPCPVSRGFPPHRQQHQILPTAPKKRAARSSPNTLVTGCPVYSLTQSVGELVRATKARPLRVTKPSSLTNPAATACCWVSLLRACGAYSAPSPYRELSRRAMARSVWFKSPSFKVAFPSGRHAA